MKRFIVCLIVLLMTALGQAALIQHLDATVAGSVVTDEGGAVSDWIDQSGSGNDATKGGAMIGTMYYPSTSRSGSGLAGVDMGADRNGFRLFDATQQDSWLDFTGAASGQSGFCVLIAFTVGSITDLPENRFIRDALLCNHGNAGTVNAFGMRYQFGNVEFFSQGSTVDHSGPALVAGDTAVVGFNYDASTGDYGFWSSQNDVVDSGNLGAGKNFSSSQPLYLGTSQNGGQYMDGMIGEVRVYDSVLSASEFQAEREAMADKWITSGLSSGAHAPQPSYGATGVPLDQVLSWKTGVDPADPEVPNAAIRQHNLWLSAAYDSLNPPSSPDWLDPDVKVFEIPADTNPADGNVDPNASYSPAGLQRDARYYWIVDESLEGATGTEDWDNIIVGTLWFFETVTSAPEVEAGRNVLTWLEQGAATVELSGTVTDATGDVTATTWSVVASPNDIAVDIADASAATTTATLTAMGQYTLELHAVDAKANEGSDQMEISVYGSACEAAKNHPDGYIAPTGDLNNDCKVDFLDFAVVAAAWLDDASLVGGVLYDSN